MPDLSKVTTSTQTLDLSGDGTASFNTPFQCDITQVDVSGVDAGTQAVVVVDGATVATIALTSGAGSAVTTGVPKATDVTQGTTGTAQDPGGASLGYVHQVNETDAGSADYIGPEVPNQAPVADNVPAGKAVSVTVTGATAGTAVVTLDRAGSEAAVNVNPGTDSTY